MEAIKIGTRREVCWDEALMDQVEGIRVQMHKPEFRNIVMECDKPWEGNTCGYFCIVEDDGYYRMYYRGSAYTVSEEARRNKDHRVVYCYAESQDGKEFTRIPVDIMSYWGTRDNNIIRDDIADNMYVFKDTNPNCPPEERYKGLAEYDPERPGYDGARNLYLFTSSDGVHFKPNRLLADDGNYDSMNVAFWDKATQQYFLFYRAIVGAHTENGKVSDGYNNTLTPEEYRHCLNMIRTIRVRTSKDFVNWGEPKYLDFGPDANVMELYTNQVQQYYRANHMFIGFPMRYIDRYKDAESYPHLPDWKFRQRLIRNCGRGGTVMTDGLIMTSRDGYHFRRTEEAFITAGPERGTNWYYGDGGGAYGMVETTSDVPGEPNEISIYYGWDYRTKAVKLARYAVRLDGFFSWHCDYKPGKVLTKTIVFDGGELHINFATSAVGYVQIRLLDKEGQAIEGFDSGKLFGNSVDREVAFKGDLSELAGKEIRLEIGMSDADLYSFKFEPLPTLI